MCEEAGAKTLLLPGDLTEEAQCKCASYECIKIKKGPSSLIDAHKAISSPLATAWPSKAAVCPGRWWRRQCRNSAG